MPGRCEDNRKPLQADILLVTATDVECQAVLRFFTQKLDRPFKRHFGENNTYFDLGIVAGTRIALVQSEMGAGGPNGALLTVYDAIKELSPSSVVMVGIAFGVDQKKQDIGDVLVSQQLLGYEFQRVGIGPAGQLEIQARGPRPQASPWLLNRFRSSVPDWHGSKAEFGLILSGDKLADNREFRDDLLRLAPDAIGGEMEGMGLYSAAERLKVDWILIKSICDWADGYKYYEKEQRQKQAAENAVSFTLHVVERGGLRRSGTGGPPKGLPPATSPALGDSHYIYDVHASWVVAVTWQPEGTHIASAGGDGTVRVWDSETGMNLLTYRGHTRPLARINLQPTIYTIAWSSEGLRIASAGDGTKIYVWNAITGQTLSVYQGHSGLLANVFDVAWSPDGKQIVSACSAASIDKTIHVWDVNTTRTVARYDAHYGLMPNFSVLALTWSPDGTRIAAACGDGMIRIWSTSTQRCIATYQTRSETLVDIAWSPDSKWIASAHTDCTAHVWNTSMGESVLTYRGHTDRLRRIAWSPDGTCIATASNDRTVQIWDPVTGNSIYTYRGHTDWATSLAWSPDGTRIASGSNDKTVRVWQAR
jgi:nucleoside phosphorylase